MAARTAARLALQGSTLLCSALLHSTQLNSTKLGLARSIGGAINSNDCQLSAPLVCRPIKAAGQSLDDWRGLKAASCWPTRAARARAHLALGFVVISAPKVSECCCLVGGLIEVGAASFWRFRATLEWLAERLCECMREARGAQFKSGALSWSMRRASNARRALVHAAPDAQLALSQNALSLSKHSRRAE